MINFRGLIAWSGALLCLGYIGLSAGKAPPDLAQAQANLPEEDMVLFGSELNRAWQDWSYTEHTLGDASVKFGGQPSIRMVPNNWSGLYLHREPFSTAGYKNLTFHVHGGTAGGQKINVCAVNAKNQYLPGVSLSSYLIEKSLPANKFTFCVIPLKDLRAENTSISGFVIQDGSGGAQSPIYIADLRLSTGRPKAPPKPIMLTVNAAQTIAPINPHIYGMSQADERYYKDLNLKLWRWGGNPTTRYNWEKGNCWNAARDWYFRNGNYGKGSPADRQPSGVADQAIAVGKAHGVDTYLTIPTMGWVARDDNNATGSENVPTVTGPPIAPGSDAIAGYDPAANRKRVSIRSQVRKGSAFADTPDLTDDIVFQDEWVYHLTRKFGKADAGGVRYYAMDNEPDLWHITHTDMHPVQPDYDELLNQFVTGAMAVKAVDPKAQIGGPVSWGWTGYFYSPRDAGDDRYATHADRKKHGDLPFLAWFLQAVAAHDRKAGRRTLDILDIHYYPQAANVYGSGTDEPTNALRLRSTRSLWDPTYTDESWIGTSIQLIPRLRQWIDKYYPGTKLGIMEWNWGADTTLNGGLAVAEVLGIFGRERLDMACYWAIPGYETPGYFAYKMYRNADGKHHGFGDVAVSAASNTPDKVSCFGSVDSTTGKPVVMLINKQPDKAASITLDITGKAFQKAAIYRYSDADLKKILSLPDVMSVGGRIKLTLPASSITLLRCK
jgi:hypothetical protein